MRSLLLARKGENAETHLKLLTIVDNSATYRLLAWGVVVRERRQYCSPVNVQGIKIKCVNN